MGLILGYRITLLITNDVSIIGVLKNERMLKMRKRTKKIVSLILIAIMCVSLLAACGGGSSNSPAPAANSPEPAANSPAPAANSPAPVGANPAPAGVDWSKSPQVLIKVGTEFGPEDMAFMINSLDWIKEQTNGTVDYEIYFYGTLVTNDQAIDGVYDNIVQTAHATTGVMSGYIPEIGCLGIPGAIPASLEDQIAFYASIRPIMKKIFESYGLAYWTCSFVGPAGFINRNKQILTPDDLKGQITRVSGGVMTDAMDAWGGTPAVVPFGDVATALERGTVDGSYTAYITFGTQHWCEVAEYITETGITESAGFEFYSLDFWNSLSQDQQNVLDASGDMFVQFHNQSFLLDYNNATEIIAANGNPVVALTDAQTKVFTDMLTPLFEEWGKTASPLGLELLKGVYDYNGWAWPF